RRRRPQQLDRVLLSGGFTAAPPAGPAGPGGGLTTPHRPIPRDPGDRTVGRPRAGQLAGRSDNGSIGSASTPSARSATIRNVLASRSRASASRAGGALGRPASAPARLAA